MIVRDWRQAPSGNIIPWNRELWAGEQEPDGSDASVWGKCWRLYPSHEDSALFIFQTPGMKHTELRVRLIAEPWAIAAWRAGEAPGPVIDHLIEENPWHAERLGEFAVLVARGQLEEPCTPSSSSASSPGTTSASASP